MKPVNGTYRLTTTGTPSTSVLYTITDAGIATTFGLLAWVDDANGGRFRNNEVAIRFLDPVHFIALNGEEPHEGIYERVGS